MQKLLQDYVRYLRIERNIAPLTVRNYTTDIRDFLDFLKAKRVTTLAQVDRAVLRRYLGALQEQGVARTSISRKLSALRSFYRYLFRENQVGSQPLQTLSAPRLEQRLPSFLSQEDVLQLIEAADLSTPLGLRDRALLELLYAAGFRVSEIVSLDLGSVNFGSREIRVWGKGSKQRIALMGQPAARAVRDYLDRGRPKLTGHGKEQALFLNCYGKRISQRLVQRMIISYARRAGLAGRVHPHMMRHTFATHLLDGGADLRAVQELLGHANLTSTQVYTHVTQRQMRRTYLAAHPRSSKEGE
ncbi:MAG: tyrosine recombinase XerC [Chloroflexi bacterium]|nr:tyrosine recombinase XerC [Chloroflexota bacterium]